MTDLHTRFCILSDIIKVAASSPKPDMTTVFHARLDGRFIDIKSGLSRKKLFV